MIILSWNIRGPGSRDKRREVRNIVRRFKCDILILCKTKVESPSHSFLCNIGGGGGGRLTKWEPLPYHRTSGGILIGWDDRLLNHVDTYKGQFSLSFKFRSDVDNFDWWLSGVYGPCPSSLKAIVLDELR